MKHLIFVLVILLWSCTPDNRPEWVKPKSVVVSCDEYYNLETKYGVLTNNVWNKHAAENDSWEQCIEKLNIDGIVQYGWSWSWPFERRVIYSQPQIKMGASPWAPEPKFNDSFPLKISKLEKLIITHELDISSNGEHNNVTTMWLLSEAYRGDKVRPDLIKAEVMIWTYSTKNHFDPAGKRHGELKIGSDVWEVWYQKDWHDKSGVNDNQWISLSFKAQKSSMKASIPALELLQFAVDKGLISKDLYIADIELGNEIMSGSGITWIKELSVSFN
ncbi:GH12 family glycosyl hydrolase domain-containing protein [Flavobacterium sp. W21_SRS_FM6]|uniref:GH12 family glycosyl hydrolase domain-containing protein n=1 Tax=Flavobacterium sp. W21_SRS_FM6 TaxID=3240268 RepID=UPI003F90C788